MRTIFLTSLFALLLAAGPCVAQNNNSFKPINSEFLTDVDGDGKADQLFYEIRVWETEYEGSFRITSAANKILWEHRYLMMKHDLMNWLGVMGDISIEDWVKGFFSNKYGYGTKVERVKLKSSDLDNKQLDYTAKHFKLSPAKLSKEILSQKENIVVSYRAAWREDLASIVYVPTLKKFVGYHRGY
jgi:hypothetical protein